MPRKNQNDGARQRDSQLAATREQVDAETQEQVARTEAARPTPTQDEIDRARLGTQSLEELDNKEADGTPEQDPSIVRSPGLTYETRDAKPAGGEGSGGEA